MDTVRNDALCRPDRPPAADLPAGPGKFSASQSADRLVDAGTDAEIARAYLLHAPLAAATSKSIRTELGRFLLWSAAEGKPLAAIRIEDLIVYKDWLRDPLPRERWVSKTRWPRTDQRWRPFSGPLSDASARQAFRVVKGLLTFATNAGYLRRDAGALVKNIRAPKAARITRYLPPQAIDAIHSVLDCPPAATDRAGRARMRDRFLFLCFLCTGARLTEISSASMGAIYTEGDGRWWLDVVGKGAKPRRLPIPMTMLDALRAYRKAFGYEPDAVRGDQTPLALSTMGKRGTGIGGEALAKAIKSLFAQARALAITQGNLDIAEALSNASVHWLRHTMLTVQANKNVSLKILQDTAGHANISTTAMYLHKDDKERHDEIVRALETP